MEITRVAAWCTRHALYWEWNLLVLGVTFYMCLAMNEQQNSKSGRLKKSGRDLLICADTEVTGNATEAVVLWDATSQSDCNIRVGDILDPSVVAGYHMSNLKPTKMYNVSVSCIEGNITKRGDVALKTGDHYSSSECTSADWLTQPVQDTLANVTLCLEPLHGFALLTFNATTPMESCSLHEAGPEQPATHRHVHLLPYTATVHVTTINTSYSIGCVHPPSRGFQTEQLTYSQDMTKTACITTVLDLTASFLPGPSIHKVRPQFVSTHVGLFVILLISMIVVIGILTFLILKRIRLQHRRQGQRLLVNEDEAAFRDLQEMDV